MQVEEEKVECAGAEEGAECVGGGGGAVAGCGCAGD